MTHPRHDDETLMAYADGELDPEEMRALERVVAEDQMLASRVAMFRETRNLARSAYEADLHDPVPGELLARVNARIAAARVEPHSVVHFPRRHDYADRAGSRWNMAMAASAAALAGLVAGYLISVAVGPVHGPPQGLGFGSFAPPAVAQILSTAGSGKEYTIADTSDRLHLTASFRDGDGLLCREFTYSRADAAPFVAVSCREGGKWRVTFAVSVPSEDGGYATASSTTTVDAYLESIQAGEPLSGNDERTALSGN
jgi:hypothetical protein